MAHSKTPWEYRKTSRVETEYESYSGYTHKYEKPREFIIHQIITKGKKIITEASFFASSPENKTTEENYQLIVQAVNRFVKELNT